MSHEKMPMYIEKRSKRAREDACIEGELGKGGGDGGEEGRKKREQEAQEEEGELQQKENEEEIFDPENRNNCLNREAG